MESRAFIKHAAVLIEKINTLNVPGVAVEQKEEVQKEINQLMSGMQNPTLPSAYKLADVATQAGYTISPAARAKLEQVEKEGWWEV